MERIDIFKHNGKEFINVDLSGVSGNAEFALAVETAKKTISCYSRHSVYTIADITNITFDTKTKELMAELFNFMKPYVIGGTVLGADGIKKIMFGDIFKEFEQTSFQLLNSKKQVAEWVAMQ